MNIGIIFGGDSQESEVSKNSGLAISQACKSLGYQTTNYLLETNSIDNEINSLKKHDFVFIALHGTFGEDGALQKIQNLISLLLRSVLTNPFVKR